MVAGIQTWILGILVIWSVLFGRTGWFNRVASANEALYQAGVHYLNKDYRAAYHQYAFVVDTLQWQEDESVLTNYAHTLFHLKQYKRASYWYNRLHKSTGSIALKAILSHQLGVIARNNPRQALVYFRRAMEENPDLEQARYNYELLLSLHQDVLNERVRSANKQNSTRSQSNPSATPQGESAPQNPDATQGQAKQAAGQDGPKNQQGQQDLSGGNQLTTQPQKNRQGKNRSRLKKDDIIINRQPLDEMGMDPEQALQLLNGMRNSEIQFLQQLKRPAPPPVKGSPKY